MTSISFTLNVDLSMLACSSTGKWHAIADSIIVAFHSDVLTGNSEKKSLLLRLSKLKGFVVSIWKQKFRKFQPFRSLPSELLIEILFLP